MKPLFPKQTVDAVKIYDDLIPDYLLISSQNLIPQIQWEYGHRTYDDDHSIGTNFFGFQYYHAKAGPMVKPTIPFVYTLFDCVEYKIAPSIGKFKDFYKGVFNGQTPDQNPGLHEDSQIVNNMWTAVYYYNDADGGTEIYDNTSKELITTAEFKKGRFVVFPSWYLHRAQQTTFPFRISAAVMFEVE